VSSTDRPIHLAIGEALALVQEEFPDVTISKIRFLESQGLISPERTASGYRKFYDDDIRRLQWVLRQQKERFLPLKVIKAKLDAGEDALDAREGSQPSLFGEPDPPPPAGPARPTASDVPASPPAGAGAGAAAGHEGVADATTGPADRPERSGSSARDDAAAPSDPGAWLAALQEGPRRRPASRPLDPPLDLSGDSGEHYSRDEVCAKTGLSAEVLGQLVDFGLVQSGRLGGEASFDDAALEVARTAAVFVEKGIEVRHLRAYKLAAERETTLIEQLTLPLLRQRNPTSRAQAADAIAELTRQGGELRHALLRQALRAHVQPR
jgi:DNA-binding transcriptional MerR regulator